MSSLDRSPREPNPVKAPHVLGYQEVNGSYLCKSSLVMYFCFWKGGEEPEQGDVLTKPLVMCVADLAVLERLRSVELPAVDHGRTTQPVESPCELPEVA